MTMQLVLQKTILRKKKLFVAVHKLHYSNARTDQMNYLMLGITPYVSVPYV